MPRPTFSILVPTYNQSAYLAKALDSLLAQTDPDWEALVVNDGSTDDTAEVIAAYSARDPRVRGFNKPNGGTGSALNRGLEEARGHWICWLSSDDLFEPDKLARHRLWFERCPDARFFFTFFKLLYERTGMLDDRHDLWGPLPERRLQTLGLLYRNFVSGISICASKEAFDEIGPFDANLRYGQDYDRWLRLSARHPGVFIPEWTVTNRNHAGQGSEVFPQACYYDTAKAAIRFLNESRFEQLVPLVDTRRFPDALEALGAALEQAARPDAFLYMLGVHPALLFCVFDWIARQPDEAVRQALWNRLETQAQGVMCAQRGAFGSLWRMAWLAARLRPAQIRRDGLAPAAIACGYAHHLRTGDPAQSDALARYCRQFMDVEVPSAPTQELAGAEVAVLLTGREDAAEAAALRDSAMLLASAGASVLILEISPSLADYRQGVTTLGTADAAALEYAMRGMRPFHVCVATGEATCVPCGKLLRLSGSQTRVSGAFSAPASCRADDPANGELLCGCAFSAASVGWGRGGGQLVARVKRLVKRALGKA